VLKQESPFLATIDTCVNFARGNCIYTCKENAIYRQKRELKSTKLFSFQNLVNPIINHYENSADT